ncbi:hypothetical protein EV189_0761 [Motilibacter rhizosphaerae]|uniref:Uncharacterized protein n=1 Tax=Motilibacter rhizosphaerae TaxID=598652 RepID=A0A4V2F543_9ACTN|nr:hypothetical protein [Motilibacter rhizosphaerae]RZS91519.1 hypothetical protein EV189_0761 [Motilibacter rhizosphaerae]
MLGKLLHRDRTPTDDRWQVVTVAVPPGEVVVPPPLAGRDDVDWKLRPAPGDRGSELAAHPRPGGPSDADLRQLLRETKQLIEVGELLQADSPGTSEKTLLNAPLRAITGRAERLGHK